MPVGLRNVSTESKWSKICYLTNYREGKPLACVKYIIWIALDGASQVADSNHFILHTLHITCPLL